MTITTVNQMISSTLGQPIFYVKQVGSSTTASKTIWYQAGFPAAGTTDTTTVNGFTLNSSSTGAIPFSNPIIGETRIASMRFSAGIGGTLALYDRLWQCNVDNASSIITPSSGTAFNIVSPTWPARDNNGSSNGEGTFLALETSSGTTGSTDATVTYTNSAGVSGRIANLIAPVTASAVSGALFFIGLQSGDLGVRSVQSIQFSTPTTGLTQTNIIAYRLLGLFSIPAQNCTIYIDPIGGVLPPILNNSCLTFWYTPIASNTFSMNATITLAQG